MTFFFKINNILSKKNDRYARTQFLDPVKRSKRGMKKKSKPGAVERGFYSDEEHSGSDQEAADAAAAADDEDGPDDGDTYVDIGELDPDHRLLLKAASPLLQSRNAAVVLSVATLFAHAAPTYESVNVGKSLTRIMRGSRETQYLVLANAVTLAAQRPAMFEPHLKQFFVVPQDAAFVRPLKIEMLTMLAKESNIAMILKEFKEYVKHPDHTFVAATIQAIGRCATTVPEVAESCMHGLLALLSNTSELVVAEAIVVFKTLLQKFGEHKKQFVSQIVRLLDNVKVVSARSAIVWMIGEYCEEVSIYKN